MSEWEKTHGKLMIERENRDHMMLEQLLPILIQFHQVMDVWMSAEFKGLEGEILHVESLCRSETSKKRIDALKIELKQIKEDHAATALQRFDELIDSIKRGRFKSPEEATAMLEERFAPVLSLIFSLRKARERLDLMSDMACTEQHEKP